MSIGKKIIIGLVIGVFIPPISVVCANLLIMFGFWYFGCLGFRSWLRSKKLERRLRAEIRNGFHNSKDNTTVDGGVIYAESYHRTDFKKLN